MTALCLGVVEGHVKNSLMVGQVGLVWRGSAKFIL